MKMPEYTLSKLCMCKWLRIVGSATLFVSKSNPNPEGELMFCQTTMKTAKLPCLPLSTLYFTPFIFSKMSYPEPPTIEAEADFKVQGAGKPCKTVRSQVLQCVAKISFLPKRPGIPLFLTQRVLGYCPTFIPFKKLSS